MIRTTNEPSDGRKNKMTNEMNEMADIMNNAADKVNETNNNNTNEMMHNVQLTIDADKASIDKNEDDNNDCKVAMVDNAEEATTNNTKDNGDAGYVTAMMKVNEQPKKIDQKLQIVTKMSPPKKEEKSLATASNDSYNNAMCSHGNADSNIGICNVMITNEGHQIINQEGKQPKVTWIVIFIKITVWQNTPWHLRQLIYCHTSCGMILK